MSTPTLTGDQSIKHLEMLQAIIARMAQSSFLIKGWSTTLCAGILAFGTKPSDFSFALLNVCPIVVFWALDAYYLSLERQYRVRYEKAASIISTKLSLCPIEPDDRPAAANIKTSWPYALVANAVWPLYGVLIVLSLAVFSRR